ncbi:hypothetical protein GUITHDRAFT_118772 [Guillardia theta CCMP2712]|uniref:Uncharacterized protein n=1 Tax=Guillardia theta (strain CCMP2712) TaxID=905079 RepID=L1IFK8_GUITC|nr:hypothetical protein GUITHDRAFT_118772 [Guillardia theta CCMP2712]EKX35023.1 hypothetical protein GUITHDRAFT_118772 [Guillardia theta CCMP2712]|eukprot:XP_005822003.1 hypothetical protein GUITHDRAFT_118772 [Guillardia theta CCMP2712]
MNFLYLFGVVEQAATVGSVKAQSSQRDSSQRSKSEFGLAGSALITSREDMYTYTEEQVRCPRKQWAGLVETADMIALPDTKARNERDAVECKEEVPEAEPLEVAQDEVASLQSMKETFGSSDNRMK